MDENLIRFLIRLTEDERIRRVCGGGVPVPAYRAVAVMLTAMDRFEPWKYLRGNDFDEMVAVAEAVVTAIWKVVPEDARDHRYYRYVALGRIVQQATDGIPSSESLDEVLDLAQRFANPKRALRIAPAIPLAYAAYIAGWQDRLNHMESGGTGGEEWLSSMDISYGYYEGGFEIWQGASVETWEHAYRAGYQDNGLMMIEREN